VAVSRDLAGAPRLSVLVAGACFGIIGLVEDLRGIAVRIRLSLQVVAVVAVMPILLAGVGGSSLWRLFAVAGTLMWMVSYVNAFNFMDGINGISVAQAVTAGTAWTVIGLNRHVDALAAGGLIMASVAIGFAPFNFPRARVFLGDVGSYAIGAFLATLAILGLRAQITPEAMLAPLALYMADTGSTLAKRAWRREPWYLPHRDHAYQRLVRHGWSHVRTTLTVMAWISACSIAGAVSLTRLVPARVGADFFLVILLAVYLALPSWLTRRARTKSSISTPSEWLI